MQMYKFMFNSCRRPAPVEDVTAMHPHSNTRVLVIRKNRFFTFDVGAPGSSRATVEEIEECVPPPLDCRVSRRPACVTCCVHGGSHTAGVWCYRQLRRIIAMAGSDADPLPVGAITSAHRDDLATVRALAPRVPHAGPAA